MDQSNQVDREIVESSRGRVVCDFGERALMFVHSSSVMPLSCRYHAVIFSPSRTPGPGTKLVVLCTCVCAGDMWCVGPNHPEQTLPLRQSIFS